MFVTVEKLAEILEVSPATIADWEAGLGLKTYDLEKKYSPSEAVFFGKVKLLRGENRSLEQIKEMLCIEIEEKNDDPPAEETQEENSVDEIKFDIMSFDDNLDFGSALDKFPKTQAGQGEVTSIFRTILSELKQSTNRAIEAEKKIDLLEEEKKVVQEEYNEAQKELQELRYKLEEKEEKLKDFEEQRKRLNLLEVRLKILQLEQSKKKFWWFWR
ncbi:hypothetical protein tpqmel_0345 [Candidatus Gastranaerophilus sp. (ex Termes propinquus)]|nr:hypothetical protein tpqmel_0345 [Candidatus Gastranaerophilus sp. (ex Termes propinquus)]